METITINKKDYYNGEEVRSQDPAYFRGYVNIRDFIKRKKIDECHYIYSYTKGGKWILSNAEYARAKILFTCEWVENNVPKMKKEDKGEGYDVEPCPPLLELNDSEKFRDIDGEPLDIMVVGEREHDKCYFLVKDVSVAFNIKNLYNSLIHPTSDYLNGEHYKYFTIVKSESLTNLGSKKEIFLTYEGMIKLLYVSKSGNARHFRKWATENLFTIQMGTKEQKQKLGNKLLGASVSEVKSVSCIYLFTLGQVKDVRKTFNISDTIDDSNIVAKYGRTDDLVRRTSEHESDYGKMEGVQLRLKLFCHIDAKHTSDAESDIKTFMTTNGYDYKYENRSELVIIPKDKMLKVDNEYNKIRRCYAGDQMEMTLEKDKLINELDKTKILLESKNMEMRLMNEKHEFEKQQLIDKLEYQRTINEHQLEIYKLKAEMAELKLKSTIK